MAGIGHYPQIGLRPGAMQIPCGSQRADHIVAALHDHCRDMPNPADVAQQLVVLLQEAGIDEVMALDAREGEREIIRGTGVDMLAILIEKAGRGLPH